MGDRANVAESRVPGIHSKAEDSDSQEAAHAWGQTLAMRREGGTDSKPTEDGDPSVGECHGGSG